MERLQTFARAYSTVALALSKKLSSSTPTC
jgi:hypothetical protein